MRRIGLAIAALAAAACIQPPANEPRPLPYPGTATVVPSARVAEEAAQDTARNTAAEARPAPQAATQQEIEDERAAIRRELADRRARLDSIGRSDSVARARLAEGRRAESADTAATVVARAATPAPAPSPRAAARDTAPRTPPPAQVATTDTAPRVAAATRSPARDTSARPAAQVAQAAPPAAPSAAQQEADAEREAIRRELAMRRARLDSLDQADSTSQAQASARRAAALDSATAAAAVARAATPTPAAAVARAETPTPAAAQPRTAAATPATARAAAPPPAQRRAAAPAPARPDMRTPIELRLDSTNTLVTGAMNISSEAMTQAQIATAERQQERIVAAMETLHEAARRSEWHAHAAIVQGDMLGVLLTAPGQPPSMADEYERYWQLARAKLDSARVQAGLAAQVAEAAVKCEEPECVRTRAPVVRDHMIAASGAAREADGYLRLAMRNVR